ncbi:cell division suppressor protein YneA [Metabacillus rhizolycopersici]|uniref:LysM peptidoglycan-binding domain-containing protein n=1 Tax=Metabacillus rhizolycopersici TaxID=2875709 RepID=A0ABS7UR35_9BACI|nr:LysM peptidoglycan-binding domain-containing protein [Metabacillus rhizolycopersici]MBZ5750537.1 LysM peptidoglycan-binding domain-containing protein [Metabacillus rhizolycopersici]
MKKETMFYILSFFFVFLAVAGAITYTGNHEDLEKFHQVKIEDGDSLWSIADRFYEKTDISKQEFVTWVQEKNELQTSIIKPGDFVFVPVKKENGYQIEQIASE